MHIERTAEECDECHKAFEHNSNIIIAGNYNKFNRDVPDILILGTYCAPCFVATVEEANRRNKVVK